MDKLSVRDASLNDAEAISRLINELGYTTTEQEMEVRLAAILRHPDYKTLLAESSGKVIGLAGLMKGIYYEKQGCYMRILAFIVQTGYRKRGAGKLLISAAEEWAKGQGLTASMLTSRIIDDRKDAYAFYQKEGYEIRSSGFVKPL